jgi:hypothetical protein
MSNMLSRLKEEIGGYLPNTTLAQGAAVYE